MTTRNAWLTAAQEGSVVVAEVDDCLYLGVEELLRLLNHGMLQGAGMDRAVAGGARLFCGDGPGRPGQQGEFVDAGVAEGGAGDLRSEEHTSELQSRRHLVCR